MSLSTPDLCPLSQYDLCLLRVVLAFLTISLHWCLLFKYILIHVLIHLVIQIFNLRTLPLLHPRICLCDVSCSSTIYLPLADGSFQQLSHEGSVRLSSVLVPELFSAFCRDWWWWRWCRRTGGWWKCGDWRWSCSEGMVWQFIFSLQYRRWVASARRKWLCSCLGWFDVRWSWIAA